MNKGPSKMFRHNLLHWGQITHFPRCGMQPGVCAPSPPPKKKREKGNKTQHVILHDRGEGERHNMSMSFSSTAIRCVIAPFPNIDLIYCLSLCLHSIQGSSHRQDSPQPPLFNGFFTILSGKRNPQKFQMPARHVVHPNTATFHSALSSCSRHSTHSHHVHSQGSSADFPVCIQCLPSSSLFLYVLHTPIRGSDLI